MNRILKKMIIFCLFVSCLLLVGIQNTSDLRGMEPKTPEIKTEVLDVIQLDPLGWVDSNIYATRDIASEEGLEKDYCYKVSSNGKVFQLVSSFTTVKGTSKSPYLVVYQDYYMDGDEKEIIGGEGYCDNANYGNVRYDLYLTRPSDGGVELTNWYYTN